MVSQQAFARLTCVLAIALPTLSAPLTPRQGAPDGGTDPYVSQIQIFQAAGCAEGPVETVDYIPANSVLQWSNPVGSFLLTQLLSGDQRLITWNDPKAPTYYQNRDPGCYSPDTFISMYFVHFAE